VSTDIPEQTESCSTRISMEPTLGVTARIV
jgi:hypothetical protein